MPLTVEPFGEHPDGSPVTRFTLESASGLTLRVLDYGGVVQALEVPDVHGRRDNVVLGFSDLGGYLGAGEDYFGGVIGRFANRISGGSFTLDGVHHAVDTNELGNSLHGGQSGFDKRMWRADPIGDDALQLTLVSPHGDQGFPGCLEVGVTYRLMGNGVRLDYTASTDAPTVLNLTNHTYFNLGGEGSGPGESHNLVIHAGEYTVVDEQLIPTGEVASVAGTPLDFRTPTPIGSRLRNGHQQLLVARGYDHNYVLQGTGLRPAARLSHPDSGRVLEVATDQPGLQLYTANFLDGRHIGSAGKAYRQGDGVALETQHFPDSPNHPDFPSTVIRPGEIFRTSTNWQFTAQ